jgi:GAF domain-containing protein/anti-sigma regulatory factor (Ser/Thr protein kinase)
MTRDAIGLGLGLGRRLRPLALAIAVLISLGLPTSYYVLEYNGLARDARLYAAELAGRLPGGTYHTILGEFLLGKSISEIRVLDEAGRLLPEYEYVASNDRAWWNTYPPVASATFVLNGAIRTVHIRLSQSGLVGVTIGLLLLSTSVGLGLGLLVYFYPVKVVRGMEARIDNLIAEQDTLVGAGRLLASTLDLREVLDRLSEIARSLPGIDVVRIWLRDESTGYVSLHSQAGVRRLDVGQSLRLAPRTGIIATVIEAGRPTVIEDTLNDPRLVNVDWVRAEGLRSYIGVPLKVGDVPMGVLACMSRARREWSRNEVALAETLAALAAVAIRNATTFGEMTRRGDRLRRVAELARAVSGALDLSAVLRQVIAAVLAVRHDILCVIRLADAEAGGYRLAASGGVEGLNLLPVVTFGEGLTSVVARTRETLLVDDVSADPRGLTTARLAAGLTLYYGVPIEAGDTVFGVLNAHFPAGAPPTADEREAIELFAGQAAVAIGNARIFGESEGRRRTAEALAEVGRDLAEALEPEMVGRRIVEHLCALLGTQSAALFQLDPESGDLVALAVSGPAAPALGRGLVFPKGTGVGGLAVASRQPAVTADILTDPQITLTPEVRARIESAGYNAVLAVPLLVKDRVIGLLGTGDRVGRVFTTEDIRLAQAFADEAVLALENSRLYDEATRRQREAEELARVARSLTESLDVANVGERIVQSVLPLFQARSSGLHLLESDRSLRAVAWGGTAREGFVANQVFAPGVGVMGRVVAVGAAVWSRDVQVDPDVVLPDDMRRRIAASGNRAVLAVPLHAKGELIGVLSIAHNVVRDFTAAEIGLLQTLADQAALALENARLYQRAQHAYEELAEAQAQLVRGETLKAMGELASGAAHHLNNLLAVVLGRLHLARSKNPGAEIARHIDLAERAALDGAEVVRRMRGFSRGHPSPNLEPLDLNRLAEEVIEFTRPRWQDEAQIRGIPINARLEAGVIPLVAGEVAALREVLMNLILNAIDALPEGGTIDVRTWTTPDAVWCEVADDGTGMSPEIQRRALEPFFTTKGYQSTGLGLSVNYGIIRRHGGDLSIDAAEGRGTRITFRLPTMMTPVATPTAPSTSSIAPLRILLIDDEVAVRHVVAEMLASQGHDVVQAADGQEGLDCLQRESVDLILTDLGMPGMTGWEVARVAKSRWPSVPVGLITGWGEDPATKPEERATADFVLAKPITVDRLRAALAQVQALHS